MNYLKWAGLLAAIVALASVLAIGAAPARAPARAGADRLHRADPNWAAAPLWDDGKAEVSTYVGTTRRYGQTRPTTARIILVKEDLVRATLVKSDRGPVPGKTVEVLKQVFVADFPTGTYAYHQVATLFFDRGTLELLRESMSHTESCGITYVRIGRDGDGLTHEAHSYWEGEADRRVAIVWPRPDRPHVHWDALPVWLRGLPQGDPSTGAMKVWLLPTQVSGRSPIASTRPVEATIRLLPLGQGTVRVPYGNFSTFRYTVESPAGRDTFWMLPTGLMIKMVTADGRRLELKKTQRLDYWRHHAVGDEKLLD